MKNKAKKTASKAMREKADEALTELKIVKVGWVRLVKGLKTDSKEVEGGSNGKLYFSEKERDKIWKGLMEGDINEEMIGTIM